MKQADDLDDFPDECPDELDYKATPYDKNVGDGDSVKWGGSDPSEDDD